MEAFMPLLSLAAIWLVIVLPIVKVSQAVNKKKAQANPGAAKGAGTARPGSRQQQAKPKPKPQAAQARPSVMQPTIRPTGHDDSIYRGSLNAVTGEGYDPCHDLQLAPLTLAETAETASPETAVPGLRLGWTGDEIVRGFVMGEILGKRRP